MHIPDGYLSPATCAALYTSSAPFWYVSLRRLRAVLATRIVPLLSLFAALSFVIMMLNLPLPGGTSGHAVGVAAATIVLGPWASMLAISVALTIQALFFGDGGITTLGANCFNVAIVGSVVAYCVYRLAAGRSALLSRRRVIAAAAAGYACINISALLTAVELGIQPLFWHDAAGTPLYAPYPLRIAVPAMMIGHLTFAGVAELVLSGGLIAYIQRTDPALLKATAPEVPVGRIDDDCRTIVRRPLWAALALLLLLTPLGVLATGTAWGEWSASDFSHAQTRQQIATSSRDVSPPQQAPAGLQKLSSVWTAPFPNYAPQMVRSRSFGYLLSAMFGAGIVIAVALGIGKLAALRARTGTADAPSRVH